MFQALVESGPRDSIRPHRYVLSFGIHALGIVAAAAATRASIEPARPVTVAIAIPFEPAPALPTAPGERRALPTPPRVARWEPVADVPAPTMPPLSLGDGLPKVGDLVKAGSPDLGNIGLAGGDTVAGALAAPMVDEPVTVVRQPAPQYPAILAQAGLTGRVVLSYVVDTTGRVEPGSVRTLTSSHPAFAAAARTTVLESRFRPAKLRGRLVRQLVTQTISFRLGT